MAMTIAKTASLADARSAAESTRVWSPVPLMGMVATTLLLCAGWRYYEQIEGFKSGLDSSDAIFWEKWLPVFYANMIATGIAQVSIPLYLWFTRDKALSKVTPEVELKRYFLFFSMMVALVFTQLIAMIFGEADAGWHQVVVRDTSLSPSHICLFFGIVPLFTTFGLSAFFFAMTRIPDLSKRVPITLLLAVLAPFMVLPSVAYNEWGHAYWLMEELFIAPLHWGFVTLALCFMASLGVIGTSLPRVIELLKLTKSPVAAR